MIALQCILLVITKLQCILTRYSNISLYYRLILKLNQSKVISSVILLVSALLLIPASGISEASSDNHPILLNWEYFQDSSDNSSEYDAFLSYGTARSWAWERIDSTECSFQITSLKSNTVIFSEKSWVKHDKKNDELLNHEQRHLDILEIFNREGNNEFQQIMFQEFECSINSTDKEIEKKVDNIVINFFNSFEQKHAEFQERYDQEVQHGIDKNKQIQWDEKIKCMLENHLNDNLCEF